MRRQLGEISAALPKAKTGKKTDNAFSPNGGENTKPQSKTEVLAKHGIDRRRANEAEKVAAEKSQFTASTRKEVT